MNKSLTTIGKRIAYAREARHLNQSELARSTGVSPTAVQKWENDTAHPSAKRYAQLANILGVSAEFLISGRAEPPRSAEFEPVDMSQDVTPVISWSDVLAFVSSGSPRPVIEGSEYVTRPSEISKRAYALRVKGASMEPEFKAGDIIFVEPDATAENGDYVIAAMEDAAEPTFKKLYLEDGKKYLVPLNPVWQPQLIPLDTNSKICGVVVAKMVQYKRR